MPDFKSARGRYGIFCSYSFENTLMECRIIKHFKGISLSLQNVTYKRDTLDLVLNSRVSSKTKRQTVTHERSSMDVTHVLTAVSLST